MGTLERLPGITGRKVGMTSNHHAPYDLGYTRATMAVTERSDPVRGSKPQKGSLSSDCSLQLDYMKLESLVIANQNVTPWELEMPEVSDPTARRELPKAGSMTGVKS